MHEHRERSPISHTTYIYILKIMAILLRTCLPHSVHYLLGMICLSLVIIKNPTFATRGYTFVIFIFIHALQGKGNILHNVLVFIANDYHTVIEISKESEKDKSNQRFCVILKK